MLADLYEGSCFGELALLHNVKRSASIISKGNSEFLRVDREGKVMGSNPAHNINNDSEFLGVYREASVMCLNPSQK